MKLIKYETKNEVISIVRLNFLDDCIIFIIFMDDKWLIAGTKKDKILKGIFLDRFFFFFKIKNNNNFYIKYKN